MLELKSITKKYITGDTSVDALKGIDLRFRENEFVSILGQSGCGKTTLLNIVGGLDQYTSGDLIINGKSTKQFKDIDWDTYRNHSIGFVFQSYNLISHQTVLSNVELALTLNGISREDRKKRAVKALVEVGLEEQIHKKPNQLSGGQMQRVAIARALVNNPDILLADEPTGALDTQTSVQIMDLLKEVAKDRLVIMVTHNPELAEHYSTRIVKLSDGLLVDDSNPVSDEEYAELAKKDEEKLIAVKKDKKAQKAQKKKSMSFATAISLSLKNLLTKKGRTVLTSIAGSIGIIGIALILALSNGIQLFINQVQEDTLSTYPLTIQKETQDMSALLGAMTQVSESVKDPDPNKIYVDDSLDTMVSAMTSTVKNDLESFKKYLDENYDIIKDYVSDIQYTYALNMQVYSADGATKIGLSSMLDSMGESFAGMGSMVEAAGMSGVSTGMDVMSEMINNQELLDQQYELVKGEWPTEYNEVVLVVGKNNQISKMTLYMLGVLPQDELEDIMKELMTPGYKYEGEKIDPIDIDEFLNMTFNLVNNSDFYVETNKTYVGANGTILPVWEDVRENIKYLADDGKELQKYIRENGTELKISGIIRPRVDATSSSISGVIGYTKALTDHILEQNANSEIIKQQKDNPEYNVLTGLKFEKTTYTPQTIHQLIDKIDDATMDQFYAIMTQMILENEEFSSRLDVKDKESFSQIFMLMPAENQAQLITAMIASANVQNPIGVEILCQFLSQMIPNVTVTPSNITTLLPIMNMQHIYVLISGVQKTESVPMNITGLIDLAGEETMSAIYVQTSDMLKKMTVTEEIFLALLGTMKETDKEFITLQETLYNFAPQIDEDFDSVLLKLGDAEKPSPASINFYAKDFASKDRIEEFISDYNKSVEEGKKLQYTDLVGALMSSVTIIIDVISYVLIAFVSISLVVSSIMIGIITNISVLERTKEIGILRAIGASKKDISRVFNAETFIVGLIAGIFGIGATMLLCLPINAIVQALTGFQNIKAVLPAIAAVILILISMGLTIVAGLIPSKNASRKDPVVALRTE